jgi:hypothetical protein
VAAKNRSSPIDFEDVGPVVPHLHRLTPGVPARQGDAIVTVVSGLPRSGTSMLMQMLTAGGMPILSDGVRKADADNPRGYFELEAAKRIRSDAGFVREAEGHAVKIVAPLLPALPSIPGWRYRVIFLERDLSEVMASQAIMLERSGPEAAETDRDDAKLRGLFGRQLVGVRAELARRQDIDTLFVRYPDAVSDPGPTSRALAAFLDADLDTLAMVAAVDASLFRQRSRG